ncbi:MAG: hypothetical protein COS08_04935 [Euryarchaeota archaeon CG01_land_8_20_14_3_00_38_12]|nr:MAG: hypothetical protein COS08_04935 [Euryarchaeota archaeon CG01_land_8_20_14_3_00_38_12]
MNILYLGKMGSLADSEIPVFLERGHRVTVLNIDDKYFGHVSTIPEFNNIINLYRHEHRRWRTIECIWGFAFYSNQIPIDTIRKLSTNISRLALNFVHTNKKNIRETIKKAIKDNNIDVVYSLWGRTPFPEIKMILKENINVPIVHNLHTYPLAKGAFGDRRANPLHKEIFERIDGRIHASRNMYEYIKKKFNLKYGLDAVLMPCFSEKYFCKKRSELLSDIDSEPHIISIGTTNFSKKFDDVRKFIQEIAKEKIHFHLAKGEGIKEGKYVHPFEPMELLRLAEFMTQFDACIVLYNVIKKYDRFSNGLPCRFLFALTAGIPIIMPENYFDACEEIIKKYDIGFAYNDVKDLKAKLYDEELMGRLKNNAIKMHRKFTLENNFHKLEKFMIDVIEHK